MKKPPIGIIPEYLWNEDRLVALEDSIIRRLRTRFSIPIEWVEERNRLVDEVYSDEEETDYKKLYLELIKEVRSRFTQPEESRHETALRYIREAEKSSSQNNKA